MRALVTGASRGIGRAVALALAEVGHDVVATMRNPDDGADLAQQGIEVARLDVTDHDTISIPDGLGILVNNAAIESPYLPVEHQPLSDWRQAFETNVFGLIEVTRRAIPSMRANGSGVIVNITTGGLPVAMPFYSVYRASKAAVAAFGESLRTEVAPFGIRVIEVIPGPIDTDMLASSARLPEAAAFEDYADMARKTQAGRLSVDPMTTPTEVAARNIVGAIDDPAVAGKIGCDPLSEQILAQWVANPLGGLDLDW